MQQAVLFETPGVATENVYYATDGCHIKIGRSSDLRRRGGELHVDVLLSFPGGQLGERRHQRMWHRYRIGNSEWFHASDELLLWLVTRLVQRPRELAVVRQLILNHKRGNEAA